MPPQPQSPPGIILAAGTGKRLGELGTRYSKATVPVGGRPLIDWCITRLHAAGVGRLVVVAHATDQRLMAFLGETYPDIAVAVQTERRGIADALCCALSHVASAPAYVASACDSVFSTVDIQRLIACGRAHNDDAAVGVLDMGPAATTTRSAVSLDGDRVQRIIEKPTDAAPTALVAAPLYWLPAGLTPFVERVQPLGNERYVSTALDDYVQSGGTVWAVRLDGRIEITTAADVRTAERLLRSEQ